MGENMDYRTQEDFAKAFVPAFKEALEIGMGKRQGRSAREHTRQLMEEVERIKAEEAQNEN
jgi:hypothetical protein